jgi:hypothetical protein
MHAADFPPHHTIFSLAPRRPSTHGGLDEGVDGGGALAALVGACEGPVVSSYGDAAQRPFGGVVRET